jgi:putative phosphoesterase
LRNHSFEYPLTFAGRKDPGVRIALISDMHGNDVAFAAAVRDLERVGVERVVCLGDALQGGAQPAQTCARLRELGCDVVLGNADAFLLEVPADSPEPVTERLLEVRDWTLRELGDDGLELIRSFTPTVEVDGEARILCFHGSPRSYDDVLIPELEEASLEPFLGHGRYDLLAGGHTHKQWSRVIDGALFVNPGSVGLAYDHHQAGVAADGQRQPQEDFKLSPVAEYAIVFVDHLGVGVEFRRVPYSYEELQAAILESGRPYAAEFAAEWRRPADG